MSEEKTPTQVEIHLPYFKQGDDLAGHIENCGGNCIEGLRSHAESLRAAATILDRIAEIATGDLPKAVTARLSGRCPLNIDADTHMIMASGETEILQKLVNEEIADPWEPEEEEEKLGGRLI